MESSVKSETVRTEEMVFQLQLLEKAYFIFKMTGAAMVPPGLSVLVGKTPWFYVHFVCESKKENINPIQTGRAAFWGPSLAKKMNKLNWQFRLYHT